MPQQIKEFELLLESLQGTIPDYKISIFHECYQQGKLTFQQAQLLAERAHIAPAPADQGR